MSIHVTRAPTVPLTSYDTKRSSNLKVGWVAFSDDSRSDEIYFLVLMLFESAFRF